MTDCLLLLMRSQTDLQLMSEVPQHSESDAFAVEELWLRIEKLLYRNSVCHHLNIYHHQHPAKYLQSL